MKTLLLFPVTVSQDRNPIEPWEIATGRPLLTHKKKNNKTQQLLISLSQILLYFSTQQPDHIIPLPKSVPLPLCCTQNKIQALYLGLPCGPSDLAPACPSPTSLLCGSSLFLRASFSALPTTHPRTFVYASHCCGWFLLVIQASAQISPLQRGHSWSFLCREPSSKPC